MPVEVTGQEVTAFSAHVGPASATLVFPGAGVRRPKYSGSCFPQSLVLCPFLNTTDEDLNLEISQIQCRPRVRMAGWLGGWDALGSCGVWGAAGDSGEHREGRAMEQRWKHGGPHISPESGLAQAGEDGPSPELLPTRGKASTPTARYTNTMPTTWFTGPHNLQPKAIFPSSLPNHVLKAAKMNVAVKLQSQVNRTGQARGRCPEPSFPSPRRSWVTHSLNGQE